MKSLIFLALLIPFASYGQRFEFSEQAGYSTSNRIHVPFSNYTSQLKGFSNQVSVGYYCNKHFLLSAFYNYNSWNTNYNLWQAEMGRNYSFGITEDMVFKYFFAGITLESTKFANVHDPTTDYHYSYRGAFCYGMHIGARKKLSTHFAVMGYIGYNWFNINGTNSFTSYHYNSTYYPQGGVTSSNVIEPVELSFRVYYFRAGLS